ncbi:hypothetical protein C8R46DRAFT_1037546 [Mycena filopes]|nr:hypothetical protein C8R46DRAFT_1037546 [Mycena filopes]
MAVLQRLHLQASLGCTVVCSSPRLREFDNEALPPAVLAPTAALPPSSDRPLSALLYFDSTPPPSGHARNVNAGISGEHRQLYIRGRLTHTPLALCALGRAEEQCCRCARCSCVCHRTFHSNLMDGSHDLARLESGDWRRRRISVDASLGRFRDVSQLAGRHSTAPQMHLLRARSMVANGVALRHVYVLYWRLADRDSNGRVLCNCVCHHCLTLSALRAEVSSATAPVMGWSVVEAENIPRPHLPSRVEVLWLRAKLVHMGRLLPFWRLPRRLRRSCVRVEDGDHPLFMSCQLFISRSGPFLTRAVVRFPARTQGEPAAVR